jgi:tetratricopeptide (TPR) repeat protein
MFILAQLHQQHGNYKIAFQLYTNVIKKNPPYEMDFNARINRARCYDAESKNSQRVKEELMKMLKDPKNKEYLDQIYYALAGLSQKENNEPEAIVHLHKSVEVSTTNQNQKALSYLELGKIYFAKPEYKLAQAYYDSCTTNLSNDHPDYTDILTRRNSLTKLVKYLKTIATEDSLQALSKMSVQEQEALIDKKFREEEDEKRKKAEEDKEQDVKQLFQQTDVKKQKELEKGTGSSWYFYNSQAVTFGTNEFTKKWGARKLEDNWRRSNKQQTVQEEEVLEDSLVVEEKVIDDPKAALAERKKKMLENIPTTPEALEKSTMKVADAYYNAAMIYNEQLGDKKASAEMFEALLQKYPDSKYKLQGYYQLYRIYLALGNNAKSDYYKDILLSKYPDSDYAMIIKNPNYMAEKEAKKSDLEIFYEETYRKYLSGQYADVIKRKSQAEMNFPNNLLLPKFDYLKTLSIGRTQSVASFTASLQDIVRIYSTDPVKDEAQEILDYLQGNAVDENKLPEKDTIAQLYTYAPDTTQMVIIAFQNINGPIKADNLKVKLSNYNSKYYGLKGYKITSQLFDHRLAIIIIKDFASREDAVNYNNGLLDNDEVYGNLNPDAYQEFIVSANNFTNFVKQKKIDEYLDFYGKFYK